MTNWRQRAPFLQAIFSDPENPLPRLVFADWLEEHGNIHWAELIRCQCLGEGDAERHALLAEQVWGANAAYRQSDRGFLVDSQIRIDADWLIEPERLQEIATEQYPAWYGAKELTISHGLIQNEQQLDALLSSPVTQQAIIWDLSGDFEPLHPGDELNPLPGNDGDILMSAEYIYRPHITTRMVELLCMRREARRIQELDLRNNELDNNAARALARSTSLIRINALQLLTGNRIRGQTWQSLILRYGEDVLS